MRSTTNRLAAAGARAACILRALTYAADAIGPPAAGQVVGGRYRVERELGTGGMGAVFAATDLTTGARVALKMMRAELAADLRAVERFRREGAALAAIRHPAVVQIREVGEAGGALFLAMELLEGETLAARLERTGPMSPSALLPIVLGLCEGLAAAHAGGIIHRDVKPSNIHLPDPAALAQAERTGAVAPVKLVDFGVARVRGYSKVTSTGLAVGTLRYMAPEQLAGGAIDERVDVYALGVVIYEALAGEHPFARTAGEDLIGTILVGRMTPLSSLRPDLPPALTRVVHRAMARLPTERIASASALAQAFRSALHGGDLFAIDETRPTPIRAANELALGPTLPATPVRLDAHPQTHVRKKRGKRSSLWLVVVLISALCIVPSVGTAGAVGCSYYLTDMQIRLSAKKLRGAIDEHELPALRADLEAFERLHREGRVGFFAASALNARVVRVTEHDDRLDREELLWVMEIVRDIVAHGGDYDIEQYNKMTGNGP